MSYIPKALVLGRLNTEYFTDRSRPPKCDLYVRFCVFFMYDFLKSSVMNINKPPPLSRQSLNVYAL